MTHLIFWRMMQLPAILGVIFLVTFLLVWVVPGNPLEAPEGQRPPPEIAAAMQRQYNLHSPTAFAQSYLSDLLLRGDFGPSLQYRDQRVNDILADGLAVSASLGVLAMIIAIFLGSAAGIIGALRPGSALDFSSLAIALIGISLPAFVTGSILLVGFVAIVLALPPGTIDPNLDQLMTRWILPAITLGVAPAAYIARLVRLGLADVMSSDFIRTARAKGLSQRQALFKHALKVAYLPVLSFLGPAAAAVMTGSFVVEEVFNIPGIGEHFVNAVRNKDQFLILGVVLVYSVILVVFNLMVDVAYVWLDPRIEL
ncbi:ABC transporter permease [Phycisphaerales bacterium AB-hyl4]|uniref:ABC transporter permease n=1 Tax=Natronomicrosphaera hydrolytica TaxID=3242702 RepID=A0ABV4U513_9BACT